MRPRVGTPLRSPGAPVAQPASTRHRPNCCPSRTSSAGSLYPVPIHPRPSGLPAPTRRHQLCPSVNPTTTLCHTHAACAQFVHGRQTLPPPGSIAAPHLHLIGAYLPAKLHCASEARVPPHVPAASDQLHAHCCRLVQVCLLALLGSQDLLSTQTGPYELELVKSRLTLLVRALQHWQKPRTGPPPHVVWQQPLHGVDDPGERAVDLGGAHTLAVLLHEFQLPLVRLQLSVWRWLANASDSTGPVTRDVLSSRDGYCMRSAWTMRW
jgi:hypothetical protein